MRIEDAYTMLYVVALTYITLLIAVMLVRAARLPGVTNRLIAVNMIGTLVNAAILILSALLKEKWLIDTALIYTMISFVSILVLIRVAEKPEEGKIGPAEVTRDE